ncbi:hypothetical protein EON65_27730 [archaeon]|nr:MAG: hypothetical protein EON65_27730 [archaeon]
MKYLPAELGDKTNVTHLNLVDNMFEHVVPCSALQRLQQLLLLGLRINILTGKTVVCFCGLIDLSSPMLPNSILLMSFC